MSNASDVSQEVNCYKDKMVTTTHKELCEIYRKNHQKIDANGLGLSNFSQMVLLFVSKSKIQPYASYNHWSKANYM